MPKKKLEESALVAGLKNPSEAAEYLNAALREDDRELFLLALKDIAFAYGGISALAKKTKLNRPSLHRMLSAKGNPELGSLEKLLRAFGLRISIDSVNKKRAS
jgi:probable addiction module antidote protein